MLSLAFSQSHGTKYPIYQPFFLEMKNKENLLNYTTIDIYNNTYPNNISIGPINFDYDLLDKINVFGDKDKFTEKM